MQRFREEISWFFGCIFWTKNVGETRVVHDSRTKNTGETPMPPGLLNRLADGGVLVNTNVVFIILNV